VLCDGRLDQGGRVAGLWLRWLGRRHPDGCHLHTGRGDAVQVLHVTEDPALERLEGHDRSVRWFRCRSGVGYCGWEEACEVVRW